MVIYGYVGLCMRMYGYVWLCRVMHGYAYNFDQRFTIKRLGAIPVFNAMCCLRVQPS